MHKSRSPLYALLFTGAAILSDCAMDAGEAESLGSSQQAISGELLSYGTTYHFQNGYVGYQGGYLDTRGAGCEGNVYCVSTSESASRDSTSGTWRLMSASGKPIGAVVTSGDIVYLQNTYASGSYLDTCGGGCEGNKFCVSTTSSSNRDGGSGTWQIWPDIGVLGSALTEGQEVHLQNGYANSAGGYLDTRGAGCEGNKFCVSTSASWNRDSGSTHWKLSSTGPGVFQFESGALKLPSPVVFETGSDILKPESDAGLSFVKDYLTAKPEVTLVRIEGHTDNDGAAAGNQTLSERRALSVAKWLVARAVDCRRLLPVGFGQTKPLVPNDTSEHKTMNRRIAFVNAAVNGKPLGGNPVDGGGRIAGDPCQ